MTASLQTMTFSGPINKRGFWLYVWRIKTPKTEKSPKGELLYVGRTGDSSSSNASSPIKRMDQHLDSKAKGNSLYTHLDRHGFSPEQCGDFKLIAYGPFFPEKGNMTDHKQPRDKAAAVEKKLADTLTSVGYDVMNKVNSRKTIDEALWEKVRDAFAQHFLKLSRPTTDGS